MARPEPSDQTLAGPYVAAGVELPPSEPVAEEPYEQGLSEVTINELKHDETTLSHEHDDVEKSPPKPELERTRTDCTQATGTSIASAVHDVEQQAPRPRTWKERLNPLKRKKVPPVPDHRQPSQEYKAHFLSHLTFWWVGSLMFVGYQRRLELNDIWEVNPDRSIDVMRAKLLSSLKKRKDAGGKRPLAMALYDTFKKDFLIGAFCQLTAACLQVLTPFTLKYLIDFATDSYEARHGMGTSPSIGYGVGLVFGITCMQLIQTTCTNHFIYRGFTVGGQSRSVLISVIFEKAMKLSGRARAGGKDPNAEEPSPKFEPGSKEEKAHFKAKLEAGSPRKDVMGDGQGWPNGRIVNLMSTDTYRVDQASGMFHMAWTSPIQALLALALLCINLTYSALAGFGFIVIMLPLLSISIKSLMVRRRAINKITDKRVSLTQEIISAVRFVKFFGWESSFLGRLKTVRNDEISKVSTLLAIRNAIMAMSISTPIFACMLAFITYTSTHPTYYLDSGPIFSSLALFNSLRQPLTMLPVVIGQIVDAFASLGRIYAFLEAEELQDDTVWSPESENAIEIANGAFTWERTISQDDGKDNTPKEDRITEKPNVIEQKSTTADKTMQLNEKAGSLSEDTASSEGVVDDGEAKDAPFHIEGINLTVGRDELVAVIGSVGCGKSSLLAALAGDMRKTDGAVTFGSARSFCPQYAWIQNATVKENIIFNKEFDRDWYNQVVDACALRPDLEMLPAGDLTEIGERGITVSGGQKQRLNIARAIYFGADIVIMDDPLSAVDAHVGRHIMDNAICGLLKGKARVLATHQLHVLHRADRIVWMKEGGIHSISTFPELMANDAEFRKLMETTAQEEKKAEEEPNEDEVEGEKKTVRKRKDKKSMAALMQQEDRAVNGVSGEVWLAYIRSAGSIWVGPLVFFLLVSQQAANIMTSLWLSYWTSRKWGLVEGEYIGIYALLGVLQALLSFMFSSSLSFFGTRSSKIMLHRAMTRVLRAPMSFFDTTPIGRIMNRFSKDVDTMDSALTDSIRMFGMTMVSIVAVFILILAYYWYFIAALVPLTFAFLIFATYYRASAPEVKRHEALLRSIVFARFGEAVNGISTIRAYGVQAEFAKSINESLDSMDGAYFLTFANQRWLSTRLDAIGNLLVFVTGILVVTARFSINPSTAGLVLSYVLSIVQLIQFTVRQLAEMENNMNSTERIHYYGTQLEEEAPQKLGQVRPTWPESGEIVFDNVQMRYREGLPLVLKGLTMHVHAGERIGVVGRTGAGKSTIMSTLFRLIELSGGSISIDGVNIAEIGLQDLRSKLAIIPQDPTLFHGTIRSNLDPFEEHTDLELWNALRQADLVGESQAMEDDSARIQLDSPVEDEGLNFSLGQRQLLALARALVRGSQIIVCDEATSSVDFETDQRIQRTIVRGFKGKTLLCIAHRLKTIIGYDRILVMDAGNVAELDSPLALFDKGGIFRSMCDRSGIRREEFFVTEETVFAAQEDEKYSLSDPAHSSSASVSSP